MRLAVFILAKDYTANNQCYFSLFDDYLYVI